MSLSRALAQSTFDVVGWCSVSASILCIAIFTLVILAAFPRLPVRFCHFPQHPSAHLVLGQSACQSSTLCRSPSPSVFSAPSILCPVSCPGPGHPCPCARCMLRCIFHWAVCSLYACLEVLRSSPWLPLSVCLMCAFLYVHVLAVN
jgi:hypothetical protein